MVAALTAFAAAAVACAGGASLAARFGRARGLFLLAWSAGLFALAIGLAGQALGFGLGFGPVTFRMVQLGAAVLGPLWLAFGLVELLARAFPLAFAGRLVVAGFSIVAGVILAVDPLRGTFGSSWPAPGGHYEILPRTLTTAAHVLTALTALTCMAVAAVNARNDEETGWADFLTSTAIGTAALFAVIGTRFDVPLDAVHPLLGGAAAGLVWFGVTRLDAPPPNRGRRAKGGHGRGARPYDDLDDEEDLPGAGGRIGERTGIYTEPTAAGRVGGDLFRDEPRRPGAGHGDDPYLVDDEEEVAVSPALGVTQVAPGLGATGAPGGADWPAGWPSDVISAPIPEVDGAGPAAGTTPPMYGLISVFTLIDDMGDAFDQVAGRAVEQVRRGEPDTIVFACHTVPSAPQQRIFYELYQDREAFEEHERRPHIVEFLREREPYVLMTNVIELSLVCARVAALPSPGEGSRPPGWSRHGSG